MRYVAGPLNLVRLLAVALEETSPEVLPDLRLLGVFTHGDHLSTRSRQLIERILRAEVTDVYGLSEIAGSACMECPACGFFHAPPIVIPEVLSPSSDAPAERKGEPVFTTLALFESLQPLIRYRTGDAVVIGRFDSSTTSASSPSGASPIAPTPRSTSRSSCPRTSCTTSSTSCPRRPDPVSPLADFGIGPVYGRPVYRLVPPSPGSARLELAALYAAASRRGARGPSRGPPGARAPRPVDGELEVTVEPTCT